jgi:6-phosphogluconolactonase
VIRTEVLSRPEVDERAALFVAEALRSACDTRGRCSLAVSGGATPREMFARLARLDVPWPSVDVFQVDERVAPRDHEDRNLTLLERELGQRIVRLHEMPVDPEDLEAAAEQYGALLEEECGRPPIIDVVHLGLGADGHTASLVPGDDVLDVRDRPVAVTGTYEGYRRMTLTFPVLDNARSIVFLVTEPEKASAVKRVLAGDVEVPAGRLQAQNVVFFATPEATTNGSNAI